MNQNDTTFKIATAVKKVASRTRRLVPGGGAIAGVLRIVSTSIDYDVTDEDTTILVDTTGGNRLVNLPSAVDMFSEGAGRIFIVKRISAGANDLDIIPDGSELIDGSASYSIPNQWEFVVIQSDGSNWLIIGAG